jgi:hypothetical protein
MQGFAANPRGRYKCFNLFFLVSKGHLNYVKALI